MLKRMLRGLCKTGYDLFVVLIFAGCNLLEF